MSDAVPPDGPSDDPDEVFEPIALRDLHEPTETVSGPDNFPGGDPELDELVEQITNVIVGEPAEPDFSRAVLTSHSRILLVTMDTEGADTEVAVGLELVGRENASRSDVDHLFILDAEAVAFLIAGALNAAREDDRFYGALRRYLLKLGATVG